MTRKKKYVIYYCNDCRTDFAAQIRNKSRRAYCPNCGEYFEVVKERDYWTERFKVTKKPWTEIEDDIAFYGKQKGLTYKEIAEELDGRSAQAVRRRVDNIKARIKKENEKRLYIHRNT